MVGDLENRVRQPAFQEKVWKLAVVCVVGVCERAGQDLRGLLRVGVGQRSGVAPETRCGKTCCAGRSCAAAPRVSGSADP